MSQTSAERPGSGSGRGPSSPSSSGDSSGSALVTDQGRTSIADGVVSKIAGLATKEVAGVHAVGGGAARALGSLRERIPGGSTNHSQGISVEVGEREAAVDVSLIAEYGAAIADLATGVRRNVIDSVERMTGLQVTEVNVEVTDVHLPDEDDDSGDDDQPRPSRVR
ncbi:Asp23/Gls24 family envelope stress response protein [Pseudokineococcus basanitobsidens]|uniref:Asp23/Gls24 family envelope stress response protein n=1 Tax=Pseudokineococcus basanitobsidens TaxID=1926649 RepID=A0ABU8RNI8_9ACTN